MISNPTPHAKVRNKGASIQVWVLRTYTGRGVCFTRGHKALIQCHAIELSCYTLADKEYPRHGCGRVHSPFRRAMVMMIVGIYRNPDLRLPCKKSRVSSKLSQLLAMLGATLSRLGTIPLYRPINPSVLTIELTACHMLLY